MYFPNFIYFVKIIDIYYLKHNQSNIKAGTLSSINLDFRDALHNCNSLSLTHFME